MGPLICMILLTSSCRKTQCIAVKESCYVYIAVSLKNNAIASNSTRKCAFRGGMPLFLQYTFHRELSILHTAHLSPGNLEKGT